ncbi:hypothetical protein PTKIN_Ptkin14bG0114400 [Pterospermum kingtungense]
MADGVLANFTSLQHLAIYNYDYKVFVSGEEIGGLRKLEFFLGRFYGIEELNSYVQALHPGIKMPCQYEICVGKQDDIVFYFEAEKIIELNSCNICTDDINVPSDVEWMWDMEEIIASDSESESEEEEGISSSFIFILPLQDDDGHPSPPSSLTRIVISSEEWWEMLQWDHPNAMSVLKPFVEKW